MDLTGTMNWSIILTISVVLMLFYVINSCPFSIRSLSTVGEEGIDDISDRLAKSVLVNSSLRIKVTCVIAIIIIVIQEV